MHIIIKFKNINKNLQIVKITFLKGYQNSEGVKEKMSSMQNLERTVSQKGDVNIIT